MLQRIKQFIDSKGITVSAFEKSIGMSNASFGRSLKNGGSIGCDKLEKILKQYPDLNPEWLITGEGVMIRDKNIPDVNTNEIELLKAEIKHLKELMDAKDRIIELLSK